MKSEPGNIATRIHSFDVFFSYNSRDHLLVAEMASKISREGFEPFLDRWYLVPGQRWRPNLEELLSSCKAVAVFIGPSGMGSWQQREVDVALDRQSKASQFPVIPILLPGCEPPLGFLRQITWIDLRNGSLDEALPALIGAIQGVPVGSGLQRQTEVTRATICPYRGLLYFREEDAPFFFGREAAVQKLAEAIKKQTFLTVVGASGSGKSSLVRAGLIPSLRRDRETEWEVAVFVPGDQPLNALTAALIPLLEPTITETDRLVEMGKLAGHLAVGSVRLRDVVKRILEKQPGTDRLLVVIDQWEEIYTLTQDAVIRRRFIDELLDATEKEMVSVLFTLRGDFVDKALGYRPLSDRLQGAQINLGPMNATELAQTISQPAVQMGLNFETGLSARILADVGEEPGTLPLLEFVLRRVWDERSDGQLLHAAYEKMGGLQGAIADRAEHVFNSFTPEEQKSATHLMLQLVHPGDGAVDTRRRERISNISPNSLRVLTKLVEERLLVTNKSYQSGDETVELAHEVLIRHWSRLKTCLDRNREFLLWCEHLRVMQASWLRSKKDKSCLLQALLLDEAFQWLADHSEELGNDDLDYIFRSSNRHAEEQFDRVMENGTRAAGRRATRNKLLRVPTPLLRRERRRWPLLKLRFKVKLRRAVLAMQLHNARTARHAGAWLNRRNYAAAVRFGPALNGAVIRFNPALKAFTLCLLIAGAGFGYVWQKSQIRDLELIIKGRELRLNELSQQNASNFFLLQRMRASSNQLDTNTIRSLKER
jgi:energy-coupling factor transporter ATP-binding protein EcfA2